MSDTEARLDRLNAADARLLTPHPCDAPVHVTTASSMHPYECDGRGKCVHCDRTRTPDHDPDECWLCHNGPPPGEVEVVPGAPDPTQKKLYPAGAVENLVAALQGIIEAWVANDTAGVREEILASRAALKAFKE